MLPEEVDHFVELLLANRSSSERILEIKRFMEEDDGKHFYMMNLLDLTDNPPELPATGADASSAELMAHYMEYMFPALFSRACHPAFLDVFLPMLWICLELKMLRVGTKLLYFGTEVAAI